LVTGSSAKDKSEIALAIVFSPDTEGPTTGSADTNVHANPPETEANSDDDDANSDTAASAAEKSPAVTEETAASASDRTPWTAQNILVTL